MKTIAMSLTNVLMPRGKLFKAFWDAMHNNLISKSCPSCVARGIRRSLRYNQIIPTDRSGTGCMQVDQYVFAHLWIKGDLGNFYGPISNYARDLTQRKPSDESTVCKIYRASSWAWSGGCYGKFLGRHGLIGSYTDKNSF